MTEILVAPTDTTVLYVSRRSELRLTKRRRFPVRNPVTGEVEGTTPGEFVAFRDGHVRIAKTGDVVLSDSLDGGESEPLPAEEVHRWMENHRLFGNQLEGFWRVDPTAPPVSNDELGALMDAALTLNEDMLREIIRQETEGWGREQILERARDALDKIEMIKAQSTDAEIAAQEAKAEPPKKPGPKPKPQA